MTINTKSAQERTASIDLAQLDRAEKFWNEAKENGDLPCTDPDEILPLIALARRSLTSDHREATSGAPAALSYADAAQWARDNGFKVPDAWLAGAAAKTEQAPDAARRLADRLKWMLDADQFRNVEAMLSAIVVPEWVYRSARDLAVSIWRDNYKATAPQWEPLDDLPGVISQIDNMVAGMRLVAAEGEVHPDDLAVDRFAVAMKAKMAASRAKGRGGWDDPEQCPAERLQSMLADHLAKGDPVDVGNFAVMLFNRCESTLSAPAAGAGSAQPGAEGGGRILSKADIDEIVYKCRQSGKDTTYDIVNAALARASLPAQDRDEKGGAA